MRERPIIFSTPMVQSILEGRKTQTRRVINSILGFGKITEFSQCEKSWFYDWCFRDRKKLWNEMKNDSLVEKCSYGQCGDRLWVRETLWIIQNNPTLYAYVADGYPESDYNIKWKKQPSIFMPRYASRITLEITNIRIERLQDISLKDIKAEGIEYKVDPEANIDPWEYFADLWDSINGKKHPWSDNSWVWVIEFKG